MLNLLPRYLILRLENIYIQQDKFTLSSVDIIASDNIYIYIYNTTFNILQEKEIKK